jgi:epoxyqueuosine reductase
MVGLDQIDDLARPHALAVMGAFHKGAAPLPEGVETLVMLGPRGPGFWAHFTQSPEYDDALPDPMDRWSRRVIDQLSDSLDALAFFPFATTPPHPFYTWAKATGRAWSSPVQFLVHDVAGLWLSYRGALGFANRLNLPPLPIESPCTHCTKPCLTACPVGALTATGYDLTACHTYLDTFSGQECMTEGCAVRAACPISCNYGRNPAQSAFHMRQFHT